MSWNYRLAKKRVADGRGGEVELYGLIEVYYDEDGEVKGWTDFIDPNGWDNIEDLKITLEHMLMAIEEPLFKKTLADDE